MKRAQGTGIDYVLSNRKVFLGNPLTADLRELAGDLAVDALCLDATSIQVSRIDDWYVVASETDWIAKGSQLPIAESFTRVQILHQHRQNSTRVTVVVAAFTEELVTVGPEGATVINGEEHALAEFCAVLLRDYRHGRIVAFRGLLP